MKSKRVLLTDGEYKHTLAAVRSIGAKGITVDVTSCEPDALSFYSCYCGKKIACPPPIHEGEFVNFLSDVVKNNEYDVLIPVGGFSCVSLSRHQERFSPYVRLA